MLEPWLAPSQLPDVAGTDTAVVDKVAAADGGVVERMEECWYPHIASAGRHFHTGNADLDLDR